MQRASFSFGSPVHLPQTASGFSDDVTEYPVTGPMTSLNILSPGPMTVTVPSPAMILYHHAVYNTTRSHPTFAMLKKSEISAVHVEICIPPFTDLNHSTATLLTPSSKHLHWNLHAIQARTSVLLRSVCHANHCRMLGPGPQSNTREENEHK